MNQLQLGPMQAATIPISELEAIRKDDPDRQAALDKLNDWIEDNYQ